jgi:hypothetical protein
MLAEDKREHSEPADASGVGRPGARGTPHPHRRGRARPRPPRSRQRGLGLQRRALGAAEPTGAACQALVGRRRPLSVPSGLPPSAPVHRPGPEMDRRTRLRGTANAPSTGKPTANCGACSIPASPARGLLRPSPAARVPGSPSGAVLRVCFHPREMEPGDEPDS